jgi:hypothetical protein
MSSSPHRAARSVHNSGTIGFTCDSPEKVKAFRDAGVASGGKSIEDPPGWRESAFGKLYLAHLRDLRTSPRLSVVRRTWC